MYDQGPLSKLSWQQRTWLAWTVLLGLWVLGWAFVVVGVSAGFGGHGKTWFRGLTAMGALAFLASGPAAVAVGLSHRMLVPTLGLGIVASVAVLAIGA